MNMTKHDLRLLMLHEFKLGHNASKASANINRAWGEESTRDRTVRRWFGEIPECEVHKLLSDAQRRHLYDKTGQTDDQPNFRNHDEFSAFHNRDPFGSFFGDFGGGAHRGFRFQFAETMKIFHEQSINFKTYEGVITGRSCHQPYLILFYSDWCMACSHIEPIWQKLVEELQPINFGIATVSFLRNSLLFPCWRETGHS
ncbi:Thioredoxin domain [Trinorchestia longiramus]|nr:Thioredoxin domain [Trinorchestia longiramus]